MGSQQLLIIVVGVIVVGIMLAVGLYMFRDQASATNRDSIANDLVHLASQAQKYYRRPAVYGGGNGSFGGLTLAELTTKSVTANGSYTLLSDPVPAGTGKVEIIGVGVEKGVNPNMNVKSTASVWPDSILIVVDN